MVLKPQDLLVALKAALLEPGSRFAYTDVARALALSRSEVHAAVGRCMQAKLMMRSPHQVREVTVNRTHLLEFVLHGVRYVFPPTLGGVTRGMPTGYAAPVLSGHLAPSDALPPVWPYARGRVRGRALEPLYRSVPSAASRDPELYAALALVDAVRSGGAREREIAQRLLTEMLVQKRRPADELQPGPA